MRAECEQVGCSSVARPCRHAGHALGWLRSRLLDQFHALIATIITTAMTTTAVRPAACLYCTVALPSSAGKGGKGASPLLMSAAVGGLGAGGGDGDCAGDETGTGAASFLQGPPTQLAGPQ